MGHTGDDGDQARGLLRAWVVAEKGNEEEGFEEKGCVWGSARVKGAGPWAVKQMGRRGSWEAQLGFLLSPSSAKTLLKTEKKQRKKRREKEEWTRNWAWGLFSRTHKNVYDPKKMKWQDCKN